MPSPYRAPRRAHLIDQQQSWLVPGPPPTTVQVLDAQLDLCATLSRDVLGGRLDSVAVESMQALQAGRETRLYCNGKSYSALRQRWIHAMGVIFRWHGSSAREAAIGAPMPTSDLTWPAPVLQGLQRHRQAIHITARADPHRDVVPLRGLLDFIAWLHLGGGDGRTTFQHAMCMWFDSRAWGRMPPRERPILAAMRTWLPEQGFRTLAEAVRLSGGDDRLIRHCEQFNSTPPWLVPSNQLVSSLADADLGDCWAQVRQRLWTEHGYAAPAVRLRTFGDVHVPLHVLEAIGRLFPMVTEATAAGLVHLRWDRMMFRAAGLLEMPDPSTYSLKGGGHYGGMRVLGPVEQDDLRAIQSWSIPPNLPEAQHRTRHVIPLHPQQQGKLQYATMLQILREAHTIAAHRSVP